MAKSKATGCGWALAGVFMLAVVGQCTPPEEAEEALPEPDTTYSISSELPSEASSNEPLSTNTAMFSEGETVYVTANSLNARAEPSTSSRVLARLPYSSPVRILDRSGNWIKVRAPAGDVWISSDYASQTRPKPRPRYTPSPSRGYSGTCPCSGPNVCIGPRGGRFCITSGGNKRYGV